MPKVELHTHLNGSIRDSTLLELIKALGEKGVINFSQVEHIIMKCICIMKKSRLLVHLAKQCLVACPVMKKIRDRFLLEL